MVMKSSYGSSTRRFRTRPENAGRSGEAAMARPEAPELFLSGYKLVVVRGLCMGRKLRVV